MKLLRRTLATLLLLVLVAVIALFLVVRSSLPDHQGDAGALAGLGAEARIERDATAMAHIKAGSERDALFALGYAHAQDRLWQIDFNRRIAQGRLAEILGPPALDADRFLRVLGVRHAARAIADALDNETRALLDSYAAGINAFLANRRGALPPEFLLTRSPAPEPWHAADSIAWSLMMAWDLSASYHRNELARLRLASQFSRAEIDELRPPYPGDAPLVTADYVETYRGLGVPARAAASAAAQLAAVQLPSPFGTGDAIGSNNWVVAGSHTQSGHALLANDPHLGLTAPSVWYFARLTAPGLDVFGATLPGVPYVLLGRNRDVAWGFTNTGPDVQDLYLERLHPADDESYQTPQGFARFETRSETIKVRGGEDVTQVVRTTRHGPVISDVLATAGKALRSGAPDSRFVLALRWAALEPTDSTMRAIRSMNVARDADAFEKALRDWQLVQQNIVFADRQGAIGMIAPGRVPVRGPQHDFKGLAPAPGWDARYDWQGWLPFEAMPRIVNPASGAIATANQKITPPGYPHFLTTEWYLPYRADRISQLLAAERSHTQASFAAIQADVISLAARDMLAALKDTTRPSSPAGRAALERLLAWDGGMRVDAPEPLLLQAWLHKLRARIFDDDFGELAADFVASSEMTQATLNVLRGQTSARKWCDDRTTAERTETCADLAAEALDSAATELASQTGRDIAGLRWGDQRQAVFEHRPLSNAGFLRRWFELSVPHPGDSYTINVGRLNLRGPAPFGTRHAASLRAIYDLAPDGGGTWVYGGGQVGHPLSSHHHDLLERWQRVEYVSFDWAETKSPTQTLLLRPPAR